MDRQRNAANVAIVTGVGVRIVRKRLAPRSDQVRLVARTSALPRS